MTAIKTILYRRRAHPARIKNVVPSHVRRIATGNGLIANDRDAVLPQSASGEAGAKPATHAQPRSNRSVPRRVVWSMSVHPRRLTPHLHPVCGRMACAQVARAAIMAASKR